MSNNSADQVLTTETTQPQGRVFTELTIQEKRYLNRATHWLNDPLSLGTIRLFDKAILGEK